MGNRKYQQTKAVFRNKKTGQVFEGEIEIHGYIDGAPVDAVKQIADLVDWEFIEQFNEYWYINPLEGGVSTKIDADDKVDQFNRSIGNYYDSKKECEAEIERRTKELMENNSK